MSYAVDMPDIGFPEQPPPRPSQTEEKRRLRIAKEAKLISEARARLDAGEGISGAELEAWFDAYMTTDRPVPVPGRQGSAGRRG
jgi:hypothetical protein